MRVCWLHRASKRIRARRAERRLLVRCWEASTRSSTSSGIARTRDLRDDPRIAKRHPRLSVRARPKRLAFLAQSFYD
jgi:hypothetical protein